jgi:hypothetical protein
MFSWSGGARNAPKAREDTPSPPEKMVGYFSMMLSSIASPKWRAVSS